MSERCEGVGTLLGHNSVFKLLCNWLDSRSHGLEQFFLILARCRSDDIYDKIDPRCLNKWSVLEFLGL